jgi:rifampin ADP-ribosylating transferase
LDQDITPSQAIANTFLLRVEDMSYFHGGPRGFQPKALLLPPTLTHTKSTTDYVGKCVHRPDRVYVTTQYSAALLYAAAFNRGVIYEVEPVGDVEPDPDCTLDGLSFQCERARIVKVHKVSDKLLNSAREVLGMVRTQ